MDLVNRDTDPGDSDYGDTLPSIPMELTPVELLIWTRIRSDSSLGNKFQVSDIPKPERLPTISGASDMNIRYFMC